MSEGHSTELKNDIDGLIAYLKAFQTKWEGIISSEDPEVKRLEDYFFGELDKLKNE